MKWKRTKKGGKDAGKDGRNEEEEDDDEKLEIDESDSEDNNNIQVDDEEEVSALEKTRPILIFIFSVSCVSSSSSHQN